MNEYVETQYVGTRPTPSGTGDAEEASAKDKAMESAQAGKQAAGDVAQTAVGKAQEVIGESTAQTRNLVGEARDQLRGHAGEQHSNAVANLRSLGDELHSMARSGQQGGVATDLVGQAADRAHGAASWLDGRKPEELLEELRHFARRRPGAFLAGALVVGVLAGRLTRGVVAAHSDEDESDAQPSARPAADGLDGARPHSDTTGGAVTDAGQAGFYGGVQPGTYAGGEYGGEPAWDRPAAPSDGPGLTR